MGKRHSKPAPPVYPPNDPLFIPIGCTGLRRSDYEASRLDLAPFLYFKITSNNYNQLFNNITQILQDINPSNKALLASIGGSDGTNVTSVTNGSRNQRTPSILNPNDYTPNTFNDEQRAAISAISTGKSPPVYTASAAAQAAHSSQKTAAGTGAAATGAATAAAQRKKDKPGPPIYQINNISDNKFVYGPVFLLTAYDSRSKIIESYIYFPSMTKNMKPWNNYNTLGMNHAWLYRLFYNYQYRYTPYSSCSIRAGVRPPQSTIDYLRSLDKQQKLKPPSQMVDPLKSKLTGADYHSSYGYGLKQGCISADLNNNNCQQSDAVHRGMGIYRDGLNSNAYPAVYFTSYMLNQNDIRIKDYINANSFTTIQRNVLVDTAEMYPGCQYMLISPNNKYFLLLGSMSLIVFYNTDGIDLNEYCFNKKSPKNKVPINSKIFRDCTITRLVMEDGYLNLYGSSDYDPDEIEQLLFTSLLTKDLTYPISIILTDDGQLKVINTNNKILNTVNIANGFTSKLKNSSSQHAGGSGSQQPKLSYVGPYNNHDDYRERLLNLIMYFKEKGLYHDDPFYKNLIDAAKTSESAQSAQSVPPSGYNDTSISNGAGQGQGVNAALQHFNSSINYLNRFDDFASYLQLKAIGNNYKQEVIQEDIKRFRPANDEDDINNPDRASGISAIIEKEHNDAIQNTETSFANTPDNSKFIEETPEMKAKRLDDEATALKKKHQDEQDARGKAEDDSYLATAKPIIPGNPNVKTGLVNTAHPVTAPNALTSQTPASAASATSAASITGSMSSKYNYDDDYILRENSLNEYYMQTNPNFVDYNIFNKNQLLNSPEQQYMARNNQNSHNSQQNSQQNSPADYNYDQERSSRIQLMEEEMQRNKRQ